MLLSSFSSELTSCGHWWLAEVNEILHDILFPRCFVGVFRGWNTNWAITWGMRCSVMFIRAKRKEWSCSLSAADRGRSNQCLCLVYTSTFLNRPKSFPMRLYSNLSCYIKDYQNGNYCFNFLEKKILYSFGTYAYRTERPVWKRFGTNTCTVIYIYIYISLNIQ